MVKNNKCFVIALLVVAAVSCDALAHKPDQSYVFLKIFDHAIEGRIEIPVGDLNQALNLDFRTDLSVTEDDISKNIGVIGPYVLERVQLAPSGVPTQLSLTGHRLFSVSFTQYAVVEFAIDKLPETPDFVAVSYAAIFDVNPDHRGLLVIEHNWKTGTFNNEKQVALTFSPDKQSQRLDLSSSTLLSGLRGMIELGTHHIAIGIDHILFIVALLLPSVMRRENRQWCPANDFRTALIHVIKIVTFFTIAHSITLSLAALKAVELSSRLVESVIALSIILVALDILVPLFKRRIWWVVFGFGLFHGFGFASVLSSMGIHSEHMALSLLGFNIGVELGQLVVVCTVFPVIFLCRKTLFYKTTILPIGALLLILVASYWFIERALLIDLPAGEILNNAISFIKEVWDGF